MRAVDEIPVGELRRILQRFEDRVDAAQRKNPPTKDFVKRAMRREAQGRCPVRLKRLSLEAIVSHEDALTDLFCEYPDDVIGIVPHEMTIGVDCPRGTRLPDALEALTRTAQWTDEWGTMWRHEAGSVGAIPVKNPLSDWAAAGRYVERSVPDPRAPERLAAARPVLQAHGHQKYCYGVIDLALFERLYCIRGMENVFIDIREEPARIEYLCEVISTYLVELLRNWAETGVDAIMISDDWGTQRGLMIAPTDWRRWFKPFYRRLFGTAHDLGLDVILHSCGNVIEIVGDLIDTGLDALDPIQPSAMDIGLLARRFGGSISFSGAVDVQHVLVSCTPAEVKSHVRELVRCLARPFGYGMILGPANAVTPDIAIGNLRAMFEACHECT